MKPIALREAQTRDADALDSFLAQHSETSMFLRGNLASFGIGNTADRHGTTFWLLDHDGITAVVGCTNAGYLMCQAPNAEADFWHAATQCLNGRTVKGLTGVPEQVDAWAKALGLSRGTFSVKETEPLYRLALGEIIVPTIEGLSLRKPDATDAQMLAAWFDGYAQDTGITPTDGVSGRAAAQVFIAHPAARILMRDGVAVAMSSLNAEVKEAVQIGGVYVSPNTRGQGLGGAVVALQLAELAVEGADTAILFAANAAAARAYERIGFCRIGSYEVALLKVPLDLKGRDHVL